MLSDESIIDIVAAEYLVDYKLRLFFSNGKQNTIDFGKFLNNSTNPLIRHYLDLNEFKQFRISYGDLVWNDYDLCFPIADLYEGTIS